MLEFEKVRWRNFLSTGNQWTEIQLNRHSTTLIVGKNGAGKSTLLDAICYALFGKPFRKINKPQLHNSITRKGLLVEIEMKISGVPYIIRRGDRPGVFQVFQDGKLLNQNAKSLEYQDTLEKQIIKCNFKSFCQIVILGSAAYQPFMALPAGNRREIIEDLLDLQVFTLMNKLLVQKTNDNNGAIHDTDSKKNLTAAKIKLIRKHLSEIQQSNDKMVEEKRERVRSTQQQIEATQLEIEDLRDRIKQLRESVSDEATISNKVKQLEALRVKISQKISSIQKEVGFFHEYDNCPTCQQAIDAAFKEEAISSKTAKIEETSTGLQQLETEYEKSSDRLSEIFKVTGEITDLNLELASLSTKINGWVDYVSELQIEIQGLKKTSSETDTSNLQQLELDITSHEDNLKSLHEKKQLYQVAAMLLKDGGIKSKIVKQYVPVINKLINKYLSVMDFFVDFQLNESFEETIKSRHRDEFSYASFSEGEKMKINLAILFTWRAIAKLRNSINTNLLIMDEVLDGSIDSDAKDAFFQILGTMTDTNVFVISHAGDALFEKFHSVIKFEKVKNFSRIVNA
jgi:DNA repair exonuclease SbcCD ATPase subunit